MNIILAPAEVSAITQQLAAALLQQFNMSLAEAAKATSTATQCLTVTEVAKRLKCHAKTVCKYIEDGKLTAANIGTWERPQYRVSEKDFTQFYQNHRQSHQRIKC